jgi:hypothetical protein
MQNEEPIKVSDTGYEASNNKQQNVSGTRRPGLVASVWSRVLVCGPGNKLGKRAAEPATSSNGHLVEPISIATINSIKIDHENIKSI